MRTAKVIIASTMLCLMTIAIPANASHCGEPPQSTHSYGVAGSASATTAQTGTVGAGATIVFDFSTFDCDGNGLPDDFDGDYEFGVGGAYFGIAGNEQVNADCGLGLHLHVGTVTVVADISTSGVHFAAGYEGWNATAEIYCEVDGVIGDDPEDCIQNYQTSAPVDPCAGTDSQHGPNLDAGVWLFFECHVSDNPVSAACATSGTVTVQ